MIFDKYFITLLKTGQLGYIELNQPIENVLDYLGQPDNYSSHDEINKRMLTLQTENTQDWITLWYKSLEIMFDISSRQLIFYKISFNKYMKAGLPNSLRRLNITSLSNITREQFRSLIHKNNIQCYRIVNSNKMLDMYVNRFWLPESKIFVNFDLEDNKDRIAAISTGLMDADSICEISECIEI